MPEIKEFAPIHDFKSFPVMGEIMIGPFVSGLSVLRRPLTIIGGIWSVVVNSIKSKPFLVNMLVISNKGFYVMPFSADINTPTPIIFKTVIGRVITSIHHVNPVTIERVLAKAMCNGRFLTPLLVIAAARLCKAANKICRVNNSFITTIAFTENFASRHATNNG